MRFSSPNKFSIASGFTLIELMVTVGIFTFMTALILARYSSFNSGTLLANTAYDVALTIRQAQTYGMSVMTTDSASPAFSSAYGVDFKMANQPVTSFVFFIDSNNNGVYNSAGGDSVVNTYSLKQGAKINGVCAVLTGTCTPVYIMTDVLDITFQRPNPSAFINYNGITSNTYAAIKIASSDGSNSHTIVVRQNGQISVQ